MSEATYDRPLIIKDFMKERRKATVKRSKFFEKVEKLPDSKMLKGQSKYLEMVNAIEERNVQGAFGCYQEGSHGQECIFFGRESPRSSGQT
jgi:hypothetical protein